MCSEAIWTLAHKSSNRPRNFSKVYFLHTQNIYFKWRAGEIANQKVCSCVALIGWDAVEPGDHTHSASYSLCCFSCSPPPGPQGSPPPRTLRCTLKPTTLWCWSPRPRGPGGGPRLTTATPTSQDARAPSKASCLPPCVFAAHPLCCSLGGVLKLLA